MARMLDRIRMAARGEVPPPPCMTLRGEQAAGR